MEIFLAAVLGMLFGFALNRVGATNPQNIINMLRLTDLHLAKVILFAIGFSSLLLFAGLMLNIFDGTHLSVKASYWGVLIGGALLGIGFALAGYCPGTGLCAAATGRFDAILFALGGLLGAFAFSLSYETFKKSELLEGIFGGKATLADTGIEGYTALLSLAPGWVVAGGLSFIIMGIAVILPKQLCKKQKTIKKTLD